MNWNGYVKTLKEIEKYQRKVRKKHARNKKMYTRGKQDAGVSYPNKVTTTRSKSSPPGFGAIGEEVEADSFDIKETLEPSFWIDNRLDSEISKRLTEIANDFIEELDIDAKIEDIRFTGSLANYNWSKYSDIDLHIILDFSKFGAEKAVLKGFFDTNRILWNDTHSITIHGYEVEIYVEDVNEEHISSGVYSIKNHKWIQQPIPREEKVDVATARKKSDNILTRINMVDRYMEDSEIKQAQRSIKRLKQKVRKMRAAGLKSSRREYSPENIAFKILRRDGSLDRLENLKQKAYDKGKSIK